MKRYAGCAGSTARPPRRPAKASGACLRFRLEDVPLLEGVREYAEQWIFPGGSMANSHAFSARVRWAEDIAEHDRLLLFDAQTSGGLLLAVSEEVWQEFTVRMQAADEPYWEVGEVVAGEGLEVVHKP